MNTENVKLSEDMKNKINALLGFVSQITSQLDGDFEIEDGITIPEGYDLFVENCLF